MAHQQAVADDRAQEPARGAVHVLHRRERHRTWCPTRAASSSGSSRARSVRRSEAGHRRAAAQAGGGAGHARSTRRCCRTIRIGGQLTKALYQYTLQDTDLQELYHWAPILYDRLRQLPGLQDVNTDLQITSPQVDRPHRPRQGRRARRDRGPDRERARQRVRRASRSRRSTRRPTSTRSSSSSTRSTSRTRRRSRASTCARAPAAWCRWTRWRRLTPGRRARSP